MANEAVNLCNEASAWYKAMNDLNDELIRAM